MSFDAGTLANEATVAAIVGGAVLAGARLWLRSQLSDIQKGTTAIQADTVQLKRNGGSSVADAAMAGRDISAQTLRAVEKLNDKFTEHLVQSARKDGEQDAKIDMLLSR